MAFKIGHKVNLGKKNALGYKHTAENKKKMSERMVGNKICVGRKRPDASERMITFNKNFWTGRKHTDEYKRKKSESMLGVKHHRWIKDRNLLKTDRQKMYDTKYKYWVMKVKNRDSWKCKIANEDCLGALEAHHILGWRSHPELRYEINNGITLCHFHHPLKRSEETRLAPTFQGLVSQMN